MMPMPTLPINLSMTMNIPYMPVLMHQPVPVISYRPTFSRPMYWHESSGRLSHETNKGPGEAHFKRPSTNGGKDSGRGLDSTNQGDYGNFVDIDSDQNDEDSLSFPKFYEVDPSDKASAVNDDWWF
jgi:hypothetical protein